uniref:Uncharacterized protein n=1 Tax=Prolemur simus TaxID=1328070 RepID=A0A8C9DQR0_PROSS
VVLGTMKEMCPRVPTGCKGKKPKPVNKDHCPFQISLHRDSIILVLGVRPSSPDRGPPQPEKTCPL